MYRFGSRWTSTSPPRPAGGRAVALAGAAARLWELVRASPTHGAALWWILLPAFLLGGCSDDGGGPAGPSPEPGTEIGVVLNSVDRSLSIFSRDESTGDATIGLGGDGSPVGFSRWDSLVAVPMGTVPAVVIVDVQDRQVVRTVGLPEGSGATGSAFLNDSVVLVANLALNTVSRVNVVQGTTRDPVSVGFGPQAVAVAGGRVFVANSRVGPPDYTPAGPGTLTVLDGATWTREATVQLTGLNPSAMAVGPEGRLWVLHSGEFGGANGSASVVDPETLQEVEHHPGFGEFPGALVFGPAGLLHVTSLAYGIAIWDPGSETFLASPDDALAPGGVSSVSDAAFDADGRLHALVTLRPGQEFACFQEGAVFGLGLGWEVAREVVVGTCPFDLAFLRIAQ